MCVQIFGGAHNGHFPIPVFNARASAVAPDANARSSARGKELPSPPKYDKRGASAFSGFRCNILTNSLSGTLLKWVISSSDCHGALSPTTLMVVPGCLRDATTSLATQSTGATVIGGFKSGAAPSCSTPRNSFVSVSFSFQADTGPIVPGRTILARRPFAFAASTRISPTLFV